MIESFGNALAEDLFDDRRTKATRSFPPELRRAGGNDQWRVVFRWVGGNAFEVQVIDYH